MAARIRHVRHQDDVREKIRASQLVNRLEGHVFGEIGLSPTQVTAALGLLRKVIADKTESKQELTVRRVESLSEEQARMMAEELIGQSSRVSGVRAPQLAVVHDSPAPGLPRG